MDPPAQELGKAQLPVDAEKPIKVLFLAPPMRGHAVPLMRLAAWFAKRPEYEAHVWLGGSWRSMAPEGAVVHDDFGIQDLDNWAARYNELFAGLTLCKNWYTSLISMIGGFASVEGLEEIATSLMVGAAKLVKKVSPHVVVADGSFQTSGALPGLCARHCSAPFVAVSCPGRPEAFTNPVVLAKMVMKYGKELKATFQLVGPMLERVQGKLVEETGPPLEEKQHTWPEILPGCKAFVKAKATWRQTFVGPFIPVAEPLDATGRRQRDRQSMGDCAGSELMAWLLDESCKDPIVYVAFGTLVRVNQDIAERFVEGLQSSSWRVLWSLPEAQQAHLPPAGRQRTARWRVEPFVPQADVLGYEGVRCFVSHCGQNSTHEALSMGVPMVCVPFYCDQYEWAASVCNHRKAGVLLDKLQASPATIRKAVTSVLDNKRYGEAALACADDLLQLARSVPKSLADEPGQGACLGVPLAAGVVLGALRGGPMPPAPAPKKCCACTIQ